VKRLVAGPGAVYICNECVHLCQEIVDEERGHPAGRGPRPILSQFDADALVSYAETLTALVGVAKLCARKHQTLPQETAIHLLRSSADVAERLRNYCLDLLPETPADEAANEQ
jgi:ATP-dependent protease Clp ATPase subunit